MSELILQAVNVCKSYQQSTGTLNVLKGVSLDVSVAEVVTVVGPSGAGKSTLLHILGGLDTPNEGRVILKGKDLYQLNDSDRAKARNRGIGFVFQFYHLLSEFNALENVVLPMLVREDSRNIKKFEQKGMDLLDRVGLTQRATHKPNQLSGGEQQRVAIARSLANDPEIILCDEPTGNLDSQSGKDIIQLLVELNKKNHQTLVIVTHDENIAKLSNRTVHMRDGQLI